MQVFHLVFNLNWIWWSRTSGIRGRAIKHRSSTRNCDITVFSRRCKTLDTRAESCHQPRRVIRFAVGHAPCRANWANLFMLLYTSPTDFLQFIANYTFRLLAANCSLRFKTFFFSMEIGFLLDIKNFRASFKIDVGKDIWNWTLSK